MTDMPRRWIALPVEIEAEQWLGDFDRDIPREWRDLGKVWIDDRGRVAVKCDDDGHDCLKYPRIGDWVGRGLIGEFYVIRKLIHDAKYRPAGTSPTVKKSWTPEQIAEQYPHLKAKRTRQLVRDGVIPHTRGGRRSIWLDQESLDALLAHGRQGGT